MKQLLFMIVVTLIGVGGSLAVSPFYGVAVYYLFAILRPQFMWEWSLPRDVNWSLYVALAAIVGTVLGIRPSRSAADSLGQEETSRPPWNNAHVLMVLFWCWACVSYVVGIKSEMGNLFMIDYAKHFIMFVIASIVIRTVRQVWIVVVLAAASLAYISYEVNYLYFVNGYLGIQRNGYGGADNNGAGLLLALGVPLCYFVWEGVQRWWRWIFIGLIPVIIHAVLMTYSRGAMVAMIVCIPVFLLRSRKRLYLMGFALVLGFAVPAMAGKEIRARFFSIEQRDNDESAQSRYASWAAAWAIALDHPIFGAGVRGSNQLSFRYGADMQGRTIHSQYLQVTADNGFVGGGLYLGTLVATWWQLRRVRRATKGSDSPEAKEAYAAACGLEGALVVFCTAGLFLSCEACEAQYILILLAAQLSSVVSVSMRQGEHISALAETPCATDDA
jgi:probable O-glycosylation ligase (exosortase A-associated)